MIIRTYNLIMDEDRNPFRQLPKMIRFQLMVMLAYMWSAVFSIWIGSMFSLWPMMVGHTAVIVAIFFTADAFRVTAGKARQTDHRSMYKDPKDGCAMYDDIWGG